MVEAADGGNASIRRATPSDEGPTRRQVIVAAATQAVARRGTAGLRLRAVAAAAGLHHATVLYHFPSRAKLLAAVAAAVEADVRQPYGGRRATGDPWADLRAQFDEGRARLQGDPLRAAALAQLAVTAAQDGATGQVVTRLLAGWRYHIAGIVRRGSQRGAFRADVEPTAVAAAVVSQLLGIAVETAAGGDAALALTSLGTFQALIEGWLEP